MTHAKPPLLCIYAVALLAAFPNAAQGQTSGRAKPAPPSVSAPAAAPAPATATPPSADVPRSAFIQSMDVDYRKRDLDGDGKVTRAEVEQFERNALIASAQSQNRAVFKTLDSDGNGVLTPGEFAGLVRNIAAPDVTAQMQRFDVNRDQVISLIEYRTATLVNFDRLDVDKDGIVTERELAGPKAAPSTINGR